MAAAVSMAVALSAWFGVSPGWTGAPVQAQFATTTSPTLTTPVKHAKFSSNVALLAEYGARMRRGRAASFAGIPPGDVRVQALLDGGLLRMDDAGRAQLYVRLAQPGSTAIADLESLGAQIELENVSGELVQLTVSVDRLADVNGLWSCLRAAAELWAHERRIETHRGRRGATVQRPSQHIFRHRRRCYGWPDIGRHLRHHRRVGFR